MAVIWAKDVLIQPDFTYYDNNAKKYDGNFYGKVNYEFLRGLSAFIDLQYRHASIHMNGLTDDYDENYNQINFQERYAYNFFNPKFGLFYQITPNHQVYGNFSVAHREPTRNDFEEHIGVDLKAERLNDWELGYRYQSKKFSAGFNFYYMGYANQFVLTGKLNDIGEMIASNENSGKSYRTGVELEAAWQPVDWFRWDVNATFSRNRNKEWKVNATEEDTWANQGMLDLGETKISFSPEIIANNILTFKWRGFKAQLLSKYISRQYMTNTGFRYAKVGDENIRLFLSDYLTNDLDLSYTFKLKSIKSVTIGGTLYNLTSRKYDNNGWAYCEIGKDANGNPYAWTTDLYESGFAPQAPFHFMAHMSLNF